MNTCTGSVGQKIESALELDKILEMATEIRSMFINMLKDSMNTDTTQGSCAFACFFAKTVFDRFTDYQTAYRGGDGHGDGGYIDADGIHHGHYWLNIQTATQAYIVDITADQFGADPVVVLPLSKAEQYVSGCQEIVEDHFSDLLEE